MRFVPAAYFSDPCGAPNPLPPGAQGAHPAALPPLLVITAELDSLRPQIQRFVAKARAKGPPEIYHCFRGVDHDFPSGP